MATRKRAAGGSAGKKPTPPKPNNRRQSYTPPETRAMIRGEYESGRYSVEKLPTRIKCGISTRTVEKWIAKYGWEKGRLASAIERKTEETTIETFARLGLKKDTFYEKIIEGFLSGDALVAEVRTMAQSMGEAGGATIIELAEKMRCYPTALNTRAKFAELVCKMTGQLADTTINVKGGQTITHQQGPDLSTWSDEDLRTYQELCERNGCGK